MGTRFRTMLAPIGVPTGDGRRFAGGGIELAETPFPFEWARSREGGHDGAVSVGVVQQATIASVKDAVAADLIDPERVEGLDPALMAVWASGEFFDDADREAMPRLAEDVAEVLHLAGNGTLGPSVDLDSFEAVPVFVGSDEPVSWEDIEAHYEETGEEPKLELLISSARVRAATLVSIPAFAETSRPLELIAGEVLTASELTALVASAAAQARPVPIAAFSRELPGPTPITYDRETGQVFGHLATWATCHVGFEGVCVTPPREDKFAWFNRYAVETADGTVWAGRITAGGRHAPLSLAASGAMAEHDHKTVVAYVRAYPDEHGIAVSGVLEPDLDARTWAVLERRKVSGDWRETPGGLSLVEVLALSPGPRSQSEPGFPIPATFSRSGRQVALTASLGPDPERGTLLTADPIDIAAEVRRALADDRAAQAARAALSADLELVLAHQRAMADENRAALTAMIKED